MSSKIPKVSLEKNIENAINEINKKGFGAAYITKNGKLEGIVTDGDLRRAILDGASLSDKVKKVMNDDPIKISRGWSDDQKEKFLRSEKVENNIPKNRDLIIPVVDKENKIVDTKIVSRDKKDKDYIIKNINDETKNPSQILVIGGAGYIGSVLCRMLLERGYNVRVMDSLMYGDHGIEDLIDRKDFEFIKGDITDISDVVESMKDVDAVVNLAAIVGDPASNLESQKTLQTNLFSTKMLGEVAKYLGVPKFVYASTCSVYGYGEDKFTEEDDTNPLSPYAQTKLESEKELLKLEEESFYPTVLRFATAYGLSERMRFDLVVNLLTAKAIQKNEITVYGEGKQKRPFVHIRDISRSIIHVLESDSEKVSGEIFNVGSEKENLSIDSMAKKIRDMVPESELKYITEKEDGRSYEVSFQKIKQELGFQTKYNIGYCIDEIKEYFEKGEVEDYRKDKYSNYKILKSA